MINLLQISNKAPYPPNDGSSIAIYNMALGLIENEVNVNLLVINTKKHFKDDIDVSFDFKSKTRYQSVYRNTDTSLLGTFLNLFSTQSYFVSRFYFKEFEDKLITTLTTSTYDIIQLEGVFMACYLPIIKKHSQAKVVLRAHNIESLIWDRYIQNEINILKKLYLQLQNKRLKKFEENAMRQVDCIVTITDVDKEYVLHRTLNKSVITCITGVNLNNYHLSSAIKKIYASLFYFGSMDWKPNQEAVDWFLKNCWDNILKNNPTCKFIIAGRNMPQRYKSITRPNVLVIENVTDVNEFYSKYNIMLVPLLSGSGLRIKLIEGLSYGKAIITTSIGKEGIPLQTNTELIIADTAEQFTLACNKLLLDKELVKSLELKSKDFASNNLNNKAITSHLVNYYKKL